MQPLPPPPTSKSFNDDRDDDDDDSSLDPTFRSHPSVSQQHQNWEAGTYNDWEALLNSPSTWSPYNIPAIHPSFSADWQLQTSPGPEPPTSHTESNLVTRQTPSVSPGSQTVATAHRFSGDPFQRQPELLKRPFVAQSRDDWEALLRSPPPRSPSPYNIPGNHSFSSTHRLVALADPSSIYADSYTSPPKPQPSASDPVVHQEPPGMPGPHTIELNTRLLSVPRLNTSLPLHRFVPYPKSGRNSNADRRDSDWAIANYSTTQTTSSLTPPDLNLDVAPGPSSGVSVTAMVPPPPQPARLGLYHLPKLLLDSREHFKRAIFNHNDGFSMDGDTLRELARCSLDTTFGPDNLDLIDWANGGAGTLEVNKISQSQKFVRDEIKNCLGACCESIYGVWNAFSQMSQKDFVDFIADLIKEEKFLNGPIEVDGVTRDISFGNIAVCTSAKQLLYSGLHYRQYISPDFNLEPLLTFTGLVIAWVLSQHSSGTFVKTGFTEPSKVLWEAKKFERATERIVVPTEH
ncbi:hypothetical protein EDD22DRAFT_956214 [Suillus occidentalis]|nr:hypothetical protein EDD22DRAFT_956214 [Suillus occidentalis]